MALLTKMLEQGLSLYAVAGTSQKELALGCISLTVGSCAVEFFCIRIYGIAH